MTRTIWVLNNISCLLVVALPVNPFSCGEFNTYYGPGNVHHLLQPPSILGIQVTKPSHDAISLYVLHHITAKIQQSIRRHNGYLQFSTDVEIVSVCCAQDTSSELCMPRKMKLLTLFITIPLIKTAS